MKNVTNKNVIFVILMNIGTLALAVYSWLLYNHRQTIIKSEKPIQNYSILEVHRGRRNSLSIPIEFNGKPYYVKIARNKCIQFDPQKIKLFYDKERDEVFEETYLGEFIVVVFIMYLCSCISLFVVIKKRLSSS